MKAYFSPELSQVQLHRDRCYTRSSSFGQPAEVFRLQTFSPALLFHYCSRKDNGETYENLAIIQMDGAKMDADWTNKFDLVTIFDACHDQMRPDLIMGYSNVFKDKQALGSTAAMMYGISTFVYALCLGAMWGKERALKMLKEAGFADARLVETPYYGANTTLYVCTKN
ncbi:hypothetical protein ANCCEY_06175 [Ancylostoma ceylanicum]|uniref:O-methyltransferase domain-containing protein n=1 Tax=Ancylostoma ceylanicum TaxID=53326 RepID=A0A0D6LRP2_9BILA|nr:hypothetical protein ANCCEY_06175 [Ancylostoma ceylanicum]